MSPYEELRVLLATLVEGEQRSGEICPFCRGGRSGEGSLSIVRHSGQSGAYKCNRAACGREGYLGDGRAGQFGTHYVPTNKPKEWEPRIYDGTIEELPDDIIKQWPTKYGWTEADIRATGCGWSPEYRRTVWKVCSPTGFVRGIELRTFNPEARAKTLHFRHSADPWVGYVQRAEDDGGTVGGGSEGSGAPQLTRGSDRGGGRPQRREVLVAVEDLLSAYRVGQVYPAASIMGSHLNFDLLMDLMKISENVVLVLDRDATTKAEKFVKRFSFLCPALVHIPITRDLKYESQDKIKEILAPAFG